MTVRTKSKIKSKKKSNQMNRSNPAWIDRILGRSRIAKDTISITVTDGALLLTGTELSESYSELHELLEKKLSKFKIEFQPVGSSKKYILNRPTGISEESSRRGMDIQRARRRGERE